MSKVAQLIVRTLSFRLSLRIIAALALLLVLALLIIFFYSRKAVKDEALLNAEQTLEATVQHIDNILLDVEQAAGNIYWKVAQHIDHKDIADKYISRLVECNPYILDSRILWGEEADSLNIAGAGWTDPMKEIGGSGEPVTTFCLPLLKNQQRIGMLMVDVSLTLLSKIVLETKPSPHSYCTLIGSNGYYIVHPDSAKLNHSVIEVAMNEKHTTVIEATEAMMVGETGFKDVVLQGQRCYVFYKPFERAEAPRRTMNRLGWSAGIIYPEKDILGNYILLLHMVVIVTVVGLLLLLILCRAFIHRQLKPLRQLSKSAQRIAEGHYDEPIAESRQHDEVGRIQNHFREMQQSLATRMGELQQLSDDLKERGEVLQAAYEQAQVADRMKTNFLYNMSSELITPISSIRKNVDVINTRWNELSDEEANRLVGEIQSWSGKVTELLNQLIRDSEKLKMNN